MKIKKVTLSFSLPIRKIVKAFYLYNCNLLPAKKATTI